MYPLSRNPGSAPPSGFRLRNFREWQPTFNGVWKVCTFIYKNLNFGRNGDARFESLQHYFPAVPWNSEPCQTGASW